MNLEIIQKRLTTLCKSADFAARGQQVIEHGTVRLGPFDAVPFKLDWEQDPLKNRSWRWRWGTLSVLAYLIAYHAQSKDGRALEVGKELINNWSSSFLESDPTNRSLNEFVWHDHGTALRAEHLLWFYTYLQHVEQREANRAKSEPLLEKHGAILADNDFYSQHTNHGLEQSRVLFLMAVVGSDTWKDAGVWRIKALARLRSELDFAYTSEGVHVENSPAYHIFVFKVFISIIKEFESKDLGELASVFLAKSKKILNFIVHVLRPDGNTPIIGDSELLRPTDSFRTVLGDSTEYENYSYAASKGKNGSKPTATFLVYPESGYAIFRSRWAGPKDYEQVVHAIFKAGPLSQYHRQQDEGHLVLYAFGEDWLIDSGMYNYNKSDPVRKYVRSRPAHNVVLIDGAKYKSWEDIRSGWWLVDETAHTVEQAITFSFTGFENAVMTRRVEFSPKVIKVTDSVQLTDGGVKGSRILWHVDQEKTLDLVDEKTVLIKSKSSRRVLKLSIDSEAEISFFAGRSGTTIKSVVSRMANKIEPSQLIEISLKPSQQTLLTTNLEFV